MNQGGKKFSQGTSAPVEFADREIELTVSDEKDWEVTFLNPPMAKVYLMYIISFHNSTR